MIELLEKMQNAGAEPAPGRRICFVCTGNTCRSPMAAAVTNAMAQTVKESNGMPLLAFSRGLYAHDGDPISNGAFHALKKAEIQPISENDYRDHIAKTISEQDVKEADLIVGMTPSHLMELMMRFPEAAGKMTAMPHPISDPFGGGNAVYERALEEILAGVKELLFGGFL